MQETIITKTADEMEREGLIHLIKKERGYSLQVGYMPHLLKPKEMISLACDSCILTFLSFMIPFVAYSCYSTFEERMWVSIIGGAMWLLSLAKLLCNCWLLSTKYKAIRTKMAEIYERDIYIIIKSLMDAVVKYAAEVKEKANEPQPQGNGSKDGICS